MLELLDQLKSNRILSRDDFVRLLSDPSDGLRKHAAHLAREQALDSFGNRIYIRGLIEFTNYCRNNCLYCGIRSGNLKASRYRLTRDEILDCCRTGYRAGFRTFVLQGGEDPYYTDDMLTDIVSAMHSGWPDCAITLSLGERSRESYQKLHDAGANRFLLRHETADPEHYALLHPESLSLENRTRCLRILKEIGYQTGSGFMVGSPYQTVENIADDLLFLSDLQPEMVGIGPFIPHADTPMAHFPPGDVNLTLLLLSLVRLMLPRALIPATTALGTRDPDGREKGILAGANVVMPNLSPPAVRRKYLLYDDKICTDAEAAEHLDELRRRLTNIGYWVVCERGDFQPATER